MIFTPRFSRLRTSSDAGERPRRHSSSLAQHRFGGRQVGSGALVRAMDLPPLLDMRIRCEESDAAASSCRSARSVRGASSTMTMHGADDHLADRAIRPQALLEHALRPCEHPQGMSRTALSMVIAAGVTAIAAAPAAPEDDTGRIAFVRNLRGQDGCAILVTNAAGTEQRRLTGWKVSCSSPAAWSGDGRRLAFYARGAVWVMDEYGTHRRRLSPASYSESSLGPGPSFSPDGRSIVFSRNPSSRVNASAVYVSRANGTLRRLTKERFAYDPVWSPQGDLIAFRSDRDDDEGDIYLMRSDGTQQRRLTRHSEDVESLAWSPDGRFLAYSFYDGPIYAVAVGDRRSRVLTRSAEPETLLAWSPDGRHIAYEDVLDQGSVRRDIHLMTAKGLGDRRLTKRFFNFHPSWSPDSRRIAFAFFTRLRGPSRDGIAVVNADGNELRQVTAGQDAFPAWQPRGG